MNDHLSSQNVYLQTKWLTGESIATSITVFADGYLILGGSSTAMHTKVDRGGKFIVLDSALAYGTTIYAEGQMMLYGTAESLTISSGGLLRVYTGGKVNMLTVESGGAVLLDSGSMIKTATYKDGDRVYPC